MDKNIHITVNLWRKEIIYCSSWGVTIVGRSRTPLQGVGIWGETEAEREKHSRGKEKQGKVFR